MWNKITTLLSSIYNSAKLYIKDISFLKKVFTEKSISNKYRTNFFIIKENELNYRISYLEFQKIININDLNQEIAKLKELIKFNNHYVRINAEMLCHFESINTLKHCQTKTYGMFYDEYDTQMNSVINDLKLISEKYDITYINEISFNITKYKKNYPLTTKTFIHLK